jgi:hypothetical protein
LDVVVEVLPGVEHAGAGVAWDGAGLGGCGGGDGVNACSRSGGVGGVGFVAAVVGVGLAVGLVVGVLGEVARFAPPTLANGKVGARADVAVGATWGGWDGGGGRVRVWSLVGWWAGWFV